MNILESLYANVLIEEFPSIIRGKLSKNATLLTRTKLPLEGVMEHLTNYLPDSHFQVKDRFYAQDEDLSIGSPQSPVVANFYIE